MACHVVGKIEPPKREPEMSDEEFRIAFLKFIAVGLDEISKAINAAIAKHKETKDG